MNIIELQKKLNDQGISKAMYHVGGGLPNEAYCISNNGHHWEVYYSERGTKSDVKKFSSELEAC